MHKKRPVWDLTARRGSPKRRLLWNSNLKYLAKLEKEKCNPSQPVLTWIETFELKLGTIILSLSEDGR